MATSKFDSAKISGIVTCIPQNFRTLDDELNILYGGDTKQVQRIKKSIGLDKRHIAQENVTTADLCEMAAIKLFENTSIDKENIDTIILVTQTPDYFQPATAAYLHGKLDLSEDCAAFDVNQGCTGYVYGLWLAYMMVQSGSCQNILLLAGDTLSKTVNPLDTAVAPIFGDAGTATLIQKSEKIEESFFTLHTNGKKFDTIIQPEGAFRTPTTKEIKEERVFDTNETRELKNLYMNGAEVFNFSIMTEPKAIQEILSLSSTTQEEIDYIIFHQANKYIISNIARRLKFPLEKAPAQTTGKYGNQSSASIPSTICDAISQEVKSSKVKLILSGFGVGLSWATCKINLENICSADIIYYP